MFSSAVSDKLFVNQGPNVSIFEDSNTYLDDGRNFSVCTVPFTISQLQSHCSLIGFTKQFIDFPFL